MESSKFRAVCPKVSFVRSFRCCGRRPSGPPAEPFLKERMALLISSLPMTIVSQDSSGGSGREVSGCRLGCLLTSFS